MTLGAALRREVEAGFSAQAREHGEAVHRRARQRDPLATMLVDTFQRQARVRLAKAQALAAAGDRAGAVEAAHWAAVAVENERRVQAAIAGEWDGTGEV